MRKNIKYKKKTDSEDDETNEFVPKGGHSGFFEKSKTPGSPSNSPRKKNTRNQPMFPATIHQLQNAKQISPKEDEFMIDSVLVNQVCIVGLIVSTNHQATNLNFVVNDSTGQMDVRVWIDTNEEQPSEYIQLKSSEWIEGRYVRVVGNLRTLVGSKIRSLVAFRLILVVDFNEIIYHFLECIYAHLYNTQGPSSYTPSLSTSQSNINFNLMTKLPPQQQSQQPQLQSFVAPPQENSSKWTPLQYSVLKTIQTCSTDPSKGISFKEICKHLSKTALEVELRETITWLSDEGHIFSTIDDNHYQLTVEDVF